MNSIYKSGLQQIGYNEAIDEAMRGCALKVNPEGVEC